MVERAFYVNSDTAAMRRLTMERALLSQPALPYERWPAVLGGPGLNGTHTAHLRRGLESYLFGSDGHVRSWGTVGNYLSHITLFEHIASRWRDADADTSFLVLQDDVLLRPDFRTRLREALSRTVAPPSWQRVLLVWFGAYRAEDCDAHVCAVRPPAGPVRVGGKTVRYYHGLQASVLRLRGIRCLLDCVGRRPIKAVDALLVHCDCPHTYALRDHGAMPRGHTWWPLPIPRWVCHSEATGPLRRP